MAKKVTKTSLIKKLDILFSNKVRSLGYCQRCNKKENLQCAHIFSRKNKNIRWNLNNVVCLCAGCHLFWAHMEPAEFIRWVETFRDLDELQRLKNEARSLKIFELEELLEKLSS